MKFLKQAIYTGYVIAKLSESVQISQQTSSGSFFIEDSLKIETGLELVSGLHFS